MTITVPGAPSKTRRSITEVDLAPLAPERLRLRIVTTITPVERKQPELVNDDTADVLAVSA
jgi:hypothetical protein